MWPFFVVAPALAAFDHGSGLAQGPFFHRSSDSCCSQGSTGLALNQFFYVALRLLYLGLALDLGSDEVVFHLILYVCTIACAALERSVPVS